jgi:hypothetical protein
LNSPVLAVAVEAEVVAKKMQPGEGVTGLEQSKIKAFGTGAQNAKRVRRLPTHLIM